MKFYVDSCIYLNLWQKERLWKKTLDFFELIERSGGEIIFSGFVLKELSYILTSEEFSERKRIFERAGFIRVIASKEDYANARALESSAGFKVSFFDCMHIILSNRLDAILVTRDRKMSELAIKEKCQVLAPEKIRIY